MPPVTNGRTTWEASGPSTLGAAWAAAAAAVQEPIQGRHGSGTPSATEFSSSRCTGNRNSCSSDEEVA